MLLRVPSNALLAAVKRYCIVSIMIVTTMQQGVKFTDFYKLLGLQPSADRVQIRQAFLQKAKQHHPDVGGSTETMLLFNEAYKTLSAATSKKAYDMLHSYHTGTKMVAYREIKSSLKEESNATLKDDYIDWYIDTVYAEYANTDKPKPKYGRFIKKVFDTYF